MYIKKVEFKNLKCFEDISIDFKAARKGKDRQANWNVIIGNNGVGKTSLLRAIAACLMDAETATRLLKPEGWVRSGEKIASLKSTLVQEDGDRTLTQGIGSEPVANNKQVQYLIAAASEEEQELDSKWVGTMDGTSSIPKEVLNDGDRRWSQGEYSNRFFSVSTILEPTPPYITLFKPTDIQGRIYNDYEYLSRSAFKRIKHNGWVSCAYGAFRRTSGFANEILQVDDSLQKRFLTLFEEGAALFECEGWLKELDRKALRNGNDSSERKTLEEAKRIICSLLLDVDEIAIEDEVIFKWKGQDANLKQMSDGYRTIFALAVDLLRWLEYLRPDPQIPINEVKGVVLIDEIDVHLHPKWQREIGFMLTKTFPNLQFIVTTHSPFVAMAAGTGALTVLRKNDDSVIAKTIPSPSDWDVERVLTEIFDVYSRTPKVMEELRRYEKLRFKALKKELNPAEELEFKKLQKDLDRRLAGEADSPLFKDINELKNLLTGKALKPDA
jgi:energy-coupling factor transporter ATP-binding protein EcfA2